MDDGKEGVLTASQRKGMRDVATACASCLSRLDYLRALGADDEDRRAAADHLYGLATKALELDAVARAEK